jgi:hypothetical protein
MKESKRAVGFNDADYVVVRKITVGYKNGKRVRKILWTCPYYRTWSNMISRCYNNKALDLQPSYKGCSVCDQWLLFSNFRAWMETQDWEGKHLDKDLLVRGNKIYRPDTCVFISANLNTFLTDSSACRGEYPIGVSYKKKPKDMINDHSKPYTAQISLGKGSKYIGLFATPEKAHQAWLTAKLEQAKILAAEQSDPRVAKALVGRYENYTED